MANYPQPIKQREELNLRLGIKSSLTKLRSVVAALYVIYKANKHIANVVYSEEINNNGLVSIKLEQRLFNEIKSIYGDNDIANLVEKTPLFSSQIEALQVGIELFFHLGKIEFVHNGLSERTGSSRFQKKLAFSTNMIVVDLYLSSHSAEDVNKMLVSWLHDEPYVLNSKLEEGFRILLNTFTEETQFKIRNNTDEIVFNQGGVYAEILASEEVSSNDIHEPVGPFRIYKSYLLSGLHPFIVENRQIIKIHNNVSMETLRQYSEMVETSLSLIPKRSVITQEIQKVTHEEHKIICDPPLQQIFYGAPGTGKSHKVKEVTDTLPKSDVFRTTFHPDSDYSTFVGCYKPKMVKAPIRDGSGHEITSACEDEKKRIAYEYEPQAFLKAYIRAYETSEPVFLVIEEINRGNCAQIFGDMFQLLDRNENGESDYAIKPETAIQEFLNEKLKDFDIEDDAIKSGEEMSLPANLHIWATMNTSDQSLFPIDSAFKRRWDWKYMPINTRKESWSIKVKGTEYSWSNFLEKINNEIDSVTHSEDKKLGFYLCKAENDVISAERFVGKVLFYLWNDVFKDYGFGKDIFNDTEGKLCFGKFYNDNGGIQEDKVELFLKNLRVDIIKTNDTSIDDPLPEVDEDGNNETTATKDFSKYSINGSGSYSKGSVVLEAMKIYIANNPLKNAEDIKNDWLALGVNVPNFVETQAMFDERKQRSRDPRINEKAKIATLQNGQTLYVSNQYNPERIANVISKINGANWNITISKV